MPPPKVFTVGLAAGDRQVLSKVTTAGTHPARMIMRARVLLESDENAGPVADRAVIADRVGVAENTVRATAKRFARDRRRCRVDDRPQAAQDAAGAADRDRRGRGSAVRAGLPWAAAGARAGVVAAAGQARRPGREPARPGSLHIGRVSKKTK